MHIPSSLDSHIRAFCRDISPKEKSIYVSVQPLPDKPANECFLIVPEHIASYGGEQLIGWAIWEWKKVLIEAEFHAVWQSPNGTLIDVTPKDFPIRSILFLPDPSRKYTGIVVDNIRKPLRNDPRIRRFCEVCHERFLKFNEGDLANQYGLVELPDDIAIAVGNINNEMFQLENELIELYGHR